MLLSIAAFVWAFFLGPGGAAAYFAICAISGVGLGADLALAPSLLADVVDADEARGAGRNEGAYFGLWNLATKLNLALAAGIALPLLQEFGYSTKARQCAGRAVRAGGGLRPAALRAEGDRGGACSWPRPSAAPRWLTGSRRIPMTTDSGPMEVTMLRSFVSGIAATLLAACASVTPQDYAAEGPALDLRAYFNGRVDAWGIVQDRSGKVLKRMAVEMTCTWTGDVGTLDERFTYADGTKETRVWTIRKDGNRYTGTAADVVGEAKGEAAGNALRWRYVLDAKRDDGGTIHLDMDDWMWLVDENTLVNKTAFSKFGVGFGEVTIFFRKR